VLICRILLCLLWYVFRILLLLDLEEEHSTNVKAHFRPNMSNFIRSTCVSPQLEANSVIPARHAPFR